MDVVTDDNSCLDLDQLQSGSVDITEMDSDALSDLNFDLLEDLESIFKSDIEGLTCPDSNCLSSQNNESITENIVQKGQKRKQSVQEIEAIVDTLKSVAVPSSPVFTDGWDSDYVSAGIPSPCSVGSPCSGVESLSSDGETSPLHDTMWEESFTDFELFPDLL
ncbi:hypothetical protein DPMN_011147 [Dreissena polymorpha]|uniref:Uncharacterized protein n=1 Tax=Dreissena polymorpha TaxID=45954 RepID=A0A9D4RZY4_DREPO|nr:hypothetical protein DPMN_011147 [Dreissena polymorpha]